MLWANAVPCHSSIASYQSVNSSIISELVSIEIHSLYYAWCAFYISVTRTSKSFTTKCELFSVLSWNVSTNTGTKQFNSGFCSQSDGGQEVKQQQQQTLIRFEQEAPRTMLDIIFTWEEEMTIFHLFPSELKALLVTEAVFLHFSCHPALNNKWKPWKVLR